MKHILTTSLALLFAIATMIAPASRLSAEEEEKVTATGKLVIETVEETKNYYLVMAEDEKCKLLPAMKEKELKKLNGKNVEVQGKAAYDEEDNLVITVVSVKETKQKDDDGDVEIPEF